VIDTNVVVRGIRAFRQQPPEPKTPELLLLSSWIEDEETFDWLYSTEILEEYRDVLRRLKVRPNVVGSFVNLLRQAGVPVKLRETGSYSPDEADDMFYHCALGGGASLIVTDNSRDFPPLTSRKSPKVVKAQEGLRLVFRGR
jgi:predicted nucleic acid-binding protein